MDKRTRDMKRTIVKECKRFGLSLLAMEHTGSTHLKWLLSSPNGETRFVTTSLSPSDRNNLQNVRKNVRDAARYLEKVTHA